VDSFDPLLSLSALLVGHTSSESQRPRPRQHRTYNSKQHTTRHGTPSAYTISTPFTASIVPQSNNHTHHAKSGSVKRVFGQRSSARPTRLRLRPLPFLSSLLTAARASVSLGSCLIDPSASIGAGKATARDIPATQLRPGELGRLSIRRSDPSSCDCRIRDADADADDEPRRER